MYILSNFMSKMNYYVYPEDPVNHNGESIQKFSKKGEYLGEVYLHELSFDTNIHLIRISSNTDMKKVKKLLKHAVVVSIQRFKSRRVRENQHNPYKVTEDLAGWTLFDSFFTIDHSYWVMKFVKDHKSRCCISYIANGKHVLYAINEEQYEVERIEYESYLKDDDPIPALGDSKGIAHAPLNAAVLTNIAGRSEAQVSSAVMEKLLEKVRQRVLEKINSIKLYGTFVPYNIYLLIIATLQMFPKFQQLIVCLSTFSNNVNRFFFSRNVVPIFSASIYCFIRSIISCRSYN